MPFLNAKALETDPDGMAFLRSVIRPNFEQEEAASRPVSGKDPQHFQAASPGQAEAPGSQPLPEASAVPVA